MFSLALITYRPSPASISALTILLVLTYVEKRVVPDYLRLDAQVSYWNEFPLPNPKA